jgi:hypothetical protein
VRRALAAAALAAAVLALVPIHADAAPRKQVLLFLLRDTTYEQAVADPVLTGLASRGGIGLMTSAGENGRDAYVTIGAGRLESSDPTRGLLAETLARHARMVGYLGPLGLGRLVALDERGGIPLEVTRPQRIALDPDAFDVAQTADLVVAEVPASSSIELYVAASSARHLVIMVVDPDPSQAQRDRGDEVTPLVFANGSPEELAHAIAGAGGTPRGLTSDTTKRDGVVSNLDVAPTILSELGLPIPDEMLGSPIRIHGDAPTDLHRRYLIAQQSEAPTGLTALAVGLAGLLLAVGLVVTGRGPSWGAAAVVAAGLLSVAMQGALVPSGWLPPQRFPLSLLLVTGIGGAIVLIALVRRTRSPVVPVALVAAAGLGFVVVEGALGWPTPWMALNGERFYGLSNGAAGIVIAGAVLLAAVLRPAAGVALITAAALFAGMPFLGDDFGGGVTLFVVAALWYVLRVRKRFGLREAAILAAGSLLGLAVLIGANEAYGGTHVARAVSSGGRFGPLSVFIHRLSENVRGSLRDVFILPWLVAIPTGLVVALRRPGPLRSFLASEPAWRDALVTLAVAGVVGYVVNDTYSTAGVLFDHLAVALFVPLMLRRVRSGTLDLAPGPTL